jgi:tetratricopeptide (TPR) repeat protein
MRRCRQIRTTLIVLCLAAQAWGASDQHPAASGAQGHEAPACVVGDQALAQKQPDLAVIEYNKCLSKSPPNFLMLSNLGIAYAQQKKFPEAIQAYGQALALDPDNATTLINLGLAYMKTNKPKEASAQFARSLMSDPQNGKALELLAYAHFELGDYALSGYEAGLVHQASPADPTAAYILGASYMRLGMNVKAIPLLDSSLSQVKSADVYMILGEAMLGVKNWQGALEAFRKAEKMDPTQPGLYADLGAGLAAMAELDDAKAAFQKELARDPDNFKGNYLLGQLDRVQGDNADALKYLEKANGLQSDNPGPAYELAVLAVQNQDYQKAEASLESILQKYPSLTDAHVLLATVYFREHKTPEAMRERAIAAALQEADHARLQSEGESLKWLSGGKSAAQTPQNKSTAQTPRNKSAAPSPQNK